MELLAKGGESPKWEKSPFFCPPPLMGRASEARRAERARHGPPARTKKMGDFSHLGDSSPTQDKLPSIPQPHTQLLLTNQCDVDELTLSQVDKLKYKDMDSDDKWRISLILDIMNIRMDGLRKNLTKY